MVSAENDQNMMWLLCSAGGENTVLYYKTEN